MIYITVLANSDLAEQYYQNINCIFTPNPFPLVITDLKINVGNIDSELINYTEFYDLNIYLNAGYNVNELNSISYYTFIDTITITLSSLQSQVYLRFGLSLSNGNVNGQNYNINGQKIKPITTNNYILSYSLNQLFNTNFNSNTYFYNYEYNDYN